ncbi:MAG: hypothetical protein A2428_15555 [Bdellovibrionales bacterium RIFOXYC1_FULL_54_43]|nr:MAG: hypothetical protein A2428_15555 [Bdellovibrionales bacterium RIFOXYC1_FULL_54_43]OFZ84783.1 MAG: hypothetical protein A2603_05375 [Bdellovibrionales bacterium RIFOXYD1_FULL_55_31]
MKQTIQLSSLALLFLIAATGCSLGQKSSDSVAPTHGSVSAPEKGTEAPPPAPLGDDWVTEFESNGDLADLTVSRMTAAEREKVRNEVSRNSVTWFNSKSGYTLYKIAGSERFEHSAFVVPKVLVIGSVDGGRASLRELSNNQVALTVPIALIDGSQRELPYATSRIRIPDSLYLDDHKRAAIQKELQDSFGYGHELTSLGSCPKTIVIKIAGMDTDVTPHVFGGPNGPTGCQPNQPFTVTLTGSRKYIERFLAEDVFNGSAEVAAMYEIAGSYTDEIRVYQVKTAKLFPKLKERLVTKSDKAEQPDTKKELTSEEADQILSPYAQDALSKWSARERFFDRVKNTAMAQMKVVFFDEKAGEKGKLYVLKDEAAFKAVDVPVRVVNESLGRQGELFYSSSIIKPILNSTNVAIRGEQRQDLTKPPTTGIAQDVFTVREGEEYELQLTSLVVHEYEFEDEQAQPKIQDKGLVCLDKPGEVLPACRKYKNECTEYKNFCKRPKAGCVKYGTRNECNTVSDVSILGCLSLGLFGGCSVRRECAPVTDPGVCLEYGSIGCDEWGSYCSQTQQVCETGHDEPICKNQISDLRISRYFSAPAPVNNHVVNAPLGNTDQDVISGLTLRFRWPDGKVVDCLALALLKEVSGQSIRFKVKNNAYCKPFPDGYKGEPVLSVVNRVATERRNIPCGIMNYSTVEGTKYYGCNGFNAVDLTPDAYRPGEQPNASSFSRSPLYLTYYPVVDVNGVLISRSGAFTSGSTSENKWEE